MGSSPQKSSDGFVGASPNSLSISEITQRATAAWGARGSEQLTIEPLPSTTATRSSFLLNVFRKSRTVVCSSIPSSFLPAPLNEVHEPHAAEPGPPVAAKGYDLGVLEPALDSFESLASALHLPPRLARAVLVLDEEVASESRS